MKKKLCCFAVALFPACLLAAQQPDSQSPQPADQSSQQPDQTAQPPSQNQQPNPNQPHSIVRFQPPSPEVMKRMADMRQRMEARSAAIDNAASHIQSLDDARKLIDLVYAEFSSELPPHWATHSLREHIARAEYESAADPRSLIPDQHLADIWNDFVEKIGAPPDTMLNAAEIHYMRDAQYVSAHLSWTMGQKQIWTIPGVFALGQDGKVANGSRALEAIRLLWQLGNSTEDFAGIHAQVQKGVLVSDLFDHPQKSPVLGVGGRSYATLQLVTFPVQQAANRYIHDHGDRAFDREVENLLKELLTD
jgi:hypothetical protein